MGLNIPEILLWWLALEIIGLAALPIAAYVGRNLKDHGYSASKPLGVLLLTYITWIVSDLAGYSTFSVLFSLGLLAAASIIIVRKKGLYVDKNYVIKFEMLFLSGFLAFVIIRAFSPDIYWTGGEKLMDITYINSLLRTTDFPPLDPWMSGTVIQYYYFGYLIVANLIKMTGVLPSIAFNLATASFFALSLTTAFGIGYDLTEKIRYGMVTAFFVTIAGNLVGFFQLLDIMAKEDVVNKIFSFNYWTSSRVIPDTINEFPFFSFLHGDVHAHMISITFQLLIILLLLGVIRYGIKDIITKLVLGLSIGFLYPLNTWDFPVYLFLALIVIVFHFRISGDSSSNEIKAVTTSIAPAVAISILSYILFLPYHATYGIQRTISMVHSGRTSLIYYLAIYGLFLYLIYRFVITGSKKSIIKSFHFRILLILFFILSVAFKFELLILLAPILCLSIFTILEEKDEKHGFVLILIITGILLSLFCELFYIKDALGTGNPSLIRLNTVFKLYISNWILWAVASGYIVFRFRSSFSRKKAWGIVAVLLILIASVYPVFATIGRSGGFRGTPGLDGEAYVRKEHIREYEAIVWFRDITGQPVVLQAPGNLYAWNTYITAFTGLPAVIGWAGHEMNWRTDHTGINERWADVDKMYTSSDPEEVSSLVKKYNITYIYYGEAESKKYPGTRLTDAHPEIFDTVFEFGDVIVYKLRDGSNKKLS